MCTQHPIEEPCKLDPPWEGPQVIPAQLRRVYETGRAVAENQIDKIEAFLNEVKLSPEA